jgi:prepilin-type N-terminal cleavage/methylation domain-containing protein
MTRSFTIKSNGFTIIELIVVIAIIAALASIVAASVAKYLNKSKDVAQRADVKQLMTVGTIYFSNHGNYDNFCIATNENSPSAVPGILAKIDALAANPNWPSQCADTNPATTQCAGNTWTVLVPLLYGDPIRWLCVDSGGRVIENSWMYGTWGYYMDSNWRCCCLTDSQWEAGADCPSN